MEFQESEHENNTITPNIDNKSNNNASTKEEPSVIDTLLGKRKHLIDSIKDVDVRIQEVQKDALLKLEELKNKRRPMEEALFHLEAFLRAEGWLNKAKDGSMTEISNSIPIEAARDILDKIGKPTHYRELTTKVLEAGVFMPGQDPSATLLSKISRDSRFKRFGRGLYGLVSWNLRKKRKTHARGKSRTASITQRRTQ